MTYKNKDYTGPDYPKGYDKDSVPNAIKRGQVARKARTEALEKKKGGHKQHEREVRAKHSGHYPHGHKNYGDVYEA